VSSIYRLALLRHVQMRGARSWPEDEQATGDRQLATGNDHLGGVAVRARAVRAEAPRIAASSPASAIAARMFWLIQLRALNELEPIDGLADFLGGNTDLMNEVVAALGGASLIVVRATADRTSCAATWRPA
jgi:hypothetical protein